MEFATQIDFINALGDDAYNLTGLPAASDLSQSAPLAVALAAANSEVEGYLRERYGLNLPLTNKHPEINMYTVKMARYILIGNIRREAMTQTDRDGYDEATAYLTKVSKGIVTLDFPPKNATETVTTSQQPMVGARVVPMNRVGASGATWFKDL